jgi:hypothetical protein
MKTSANNINYLDLKIFKWLISLVMVGGDDQGDYISVYHEVEKARTDTRLLYELATTSERQVGGRWEAKMTSENAISD